MKMIIIEFLDDIVNCVSYIPSTHASTHRNITEITFRNLCTARVSRLTPHLLIGRRRGDHVGPAFIGNGILFAQSHRPTSEITHILIGKVLDPRGFTL